MPAHRKTKKSGPSASRVAKKTSKPTQKKKAAHKKAMAMLAFEAVGGGQVRLTIGGVNQARANFDGTPVVLMGSGSLGAQVWLAPGAHTLYWRVRGAPGGAYTVTLSGAYAGSKNGTLGPAGESEGYKSFVVP